MNAASWLEGLQPPDKWRALALAHGPRIATWVLAFALAVQAAVIVTNFSGSSRPAKVAPATLLQPSRSQSVDVAAIATAHLFGAPPIEAPAGLAVGSEQKRNMHMVLVGIFE